MTGLNTRRDMGRLRRRAFAGLLASCLGMTAAASNSPIEFPQYIRESWDASRGYPGGRVYGFAQTNDGYLWIGTDRGLIRFDGSVFRVFRQIGSGHSLIDSVFSLAADRQGNLLVSSKGIQRLRLRNEELEELPRLPGQPVDTLSSMFSERNGNLLARVRGGMVTYDGQSFTLFRSAFPQITAAAQARDGTVWMGTSMAGLFAFPGVPRANQPKILYHIRVNALVPYGEHGLMMGTDDGLWQWDGANALGRVSGPRNIQVMLEDRQKSVWLGSAEGLYRIASGGAMQLAVPVSGEGMTSLFQDREGDIWAGTSTGILRLRQRILTTFELEPGTGGGGSLFADDQGVVWYARPNLGLVRIVESQAELVLGARDCTSLAGHGADLWLGQKDGLVLRVKLPASKVHGSARKEVRFGSSIIALFKTGEGTLWVGTQNSGLAEVGKGHTVLHTSEAGLVLNTVTAIDQSRDGVTWFATANGVASLSQNRWTSYSARDGMPPGRVNCLLADGSGVLWAGGDQGLAYIQKGKVHLPASGPQLLHEPIFGIGEDRDDFLWILTSSHVFRVKRTDLLDGLGGAIFVRQFNLDDGLPAVPPSRTSRSIVTDGAGRIWMSLGNTLVMADPSQVQQPSPPTLVQFQRVSADEVSLPLGETVFVPASRVRTVIHFAGLNLAAPDRVRFRYKLKGVENNWSEITSVGEASYTNLAPGTHRFEVQASNIDGLWNGPSAVIRLNVEAAFWQTMWFQAAVALAIFATSAAAYHAKLRAAERQWNLRFQERLDERTRIARELHDTLLQSFHGLILRFQAARDMLPEEPDTACAALGSAIDRAAAAISEGRDAVQSLRGEEQCDDLGESLANIDREFRSIAEDGHQPEVETCYRVLVEGTPRRLHPVARDELYRIAREAVRNAFRHANATRIELDIRYDSWWFRLRIRDDGQGIDPQVLGSGQRQGHYGLPGMRERATSIGGQFEIWSEAGRGTEIEITLPGRIVYGRMDDSTNIRIY